MEVRSGEAFKVSIGHLSNSNNPALQNQIHLLKTIKRGHKRAAPAPRGLPPAAKGFRTLAKTHHPPNPLYHHRKLHADDDDKSPYPSPSPAPTAHITPVQTRHASRSLRHQAIHRDLPAQGCFVFVPPVPFLLPPNLRRRPQLADQRGEANRTAARIKRNRKSQQIKFKVRCRRFLYTLVLRDSDKADKLKQSLPPSRFFLFGFFVSMRWVFAVCVDGTDC